MKVNKTEHYLFLNKNKHIQELIEKVGLNEASSFPAPVSGTCLTRTCMITCSEPLIDDTLYRNSIGAL